MTFAEYSIILWGGLRLKYGYANTLNDNNPYTNHMVEHAYANTTDNYKLLDNGLYILCCPSALTTNGEPWYVYENDYRTVYILDSRSLDFNNIVSFEEVKNKTWTFDVVLPGRILVVEQTGRGKHNMYKGSMDDLTTYQDALKNKETDIMVVITEWSKTMKGTVIYKNFDLTE